MLEIEERNEVTHLVCQMIHQIDLKKLAKEIKCIQLDNKVSVDEAFKMTKTGEMIKTMIDIAKTLVKQIKEVTA